MNLVWLVAVIFGAVCVWGFVKYKDLKTPKWLENCFNIALISFVIIFIDIYGIEVTLLGLLIGLLPLWIWARQQLKLKNTSKDSLLYQFASLFPFLFVIFFVRAFLVQPYRVPTGSLAPTVHIGDFILANQMSYGLKLPISHKPIMSVGQPKRGDIALFYWPIQIDTILVKRVIGLPGDKISYHKHQLKINGQLVPTKFIGVENFVSHDIDDIKVNKYQETLPGNIVHTVYQNYNNIDNGGDGTWVVPEKHYFMMGDNRDNSNDSRYWGMVPESALVGRAMFVWMNFNVPALLQHKWSEIILWRRIGTPL